MTPRTVYVIDTAKIQREQKCNKPDERVWGGINAEGLEVNLFNSLNYRDNKL